MKILVMIVLAAVCSSVFAQTPAPAQPGPDQQIECHKLGILAYIMKERREQQKAPGDEYTTLAVLETMTADPPFNTLGRRWMRVFSYIQGNSISVAEAHASPAMVSAQVFTDCLRGDYR